MIKKIEKLSVIIIAKDAEEEIVDALFSAKFADEIIVVDGGSEDRTVDIAKKEGAEVFEHVSADFSDMRNFGLQKAKGEWVLYVDTDERVTPELASSITHQIIRRKDDKIVAFKIKRKNFYLGKHEWPYVEDMERLFLRKRLKEWQGKLHETPIFDGKIGQLDGFLFHYTHRDLSSMLKKTIIWSKTEAELRLKANHPKMTWWRFPRVMMSAFLDSYIRQGGWKAGAAGLIESVYQSFSMFITYAKLWELQQKKSEK